MRTRATVEQADALVRQVGAWTPGFVSGRIGMMLAGYSNIGQSVKSGLAQSAFGVD